MNAPAKLGPGAMVAGPLYGEVKRRVLRSLMSGEWPREQPIPTEAELADRYGVSVGTVRKALGELVQERILVRQPGRGTFATRHDRDHMLETFYNIVNEHGQKEFPESEVLSFAKTIVDEPARRHLEIEAGAEVIAYENRLSLAGRPVIYDRIVVPRAVFPELTDGLIRDRTMTIFGIYQTHFGITVARLEEWVRAAGAPAAIAQHLRLDRGAPVLAVERVARTYDGRPVEYRERYVDTKNHSYLNVLGVK